jgi:hypothetical protein
LSKQGKKKWKGSPLPAKWTNTSRPKNKEEWREYFKAMDRIGRVKRRKSLGKKEMRLGYAKVHFPNPTGKTIIGEKKEALYKAYSGHFESNRRKH